MNSLQRFSKRLKGWPGWALVGVALVALLIVGSSQHSGPLTGEERANEISKRVACPICDGESVFESRNGTSASIRAEISRQVQAGTASDDQIVTFIEQRFGGRVLLVPKATGIDALVWILPVVAFVCAVGGLVFAFRRWKRAADTVPDDDDRELVAAALAGEPEHEP